MAICNDDPASVNIYGIYETVLSWSDLELVKDPLYLNLILGSTIGLGWFSLLVDVLLAWAKSHDWRSHKWGLLNKVVDWFVDPLDKEAGFWDEAVLLQALGK